MIYVKDIEVVNFGPFKGAQRISLGEGVHAVTASREGDLEKSNWVGKSWFLSTVPFALLGWHMAKTEDRLITHGEKHAEVVFHLSNGARIRRHRNRGSSTKCSFRPQGGMECSDAHADAAILEMLGMTERDYFATSFARQKEISALIVGLPSERLKMVRSWLELEALEAREARAWAKAVDAQKAYADLCRPGEALEEHRAKLHGLLGRSDDAALALKLAEARAEMAAQEAAVAALADERAKRDNASGAADARARLELVETEYRKQQTQVDSMPIVSDGELAVSQQVLNEVRAAHAPHATAKQQAAQAAKGEFDGTCPVAGIACPAKEQINTTTAAGRVHLQTVTANAEIFRLAVEKAELAHTALGKARSDRRLAETKLIGLSEQVSGLKAAASREVEALPENEVPVVERLRLARERLSDLARAVMGWEQLEAETGRLRAALPPKERYASGQNAVTAARAAAKIWKKVQTMVGEGAMDAVGRGANAALRDAAIDLSVAVSWARYGEGYASSCEECGAPYPTSTKVRACSWCGAQRGPKMVERLDIEPSDRSGAADDLAGIGVRLSASAWLRERKQIQWSNACIDEPFGSLDVANKRAIATHLTSMLGGKYGFVQTFVVAHDRIVTDALPRRIHIDAAKDKTARLSADWP